MCVILTGWSGVSPFVGMRAIFFTSPQRPHRTGRRWCSRHSGWAVAELFGDEELRAVGVGSGVGVGETSGAIELDRRRSLILELIAGIALPVAGWVSALNHEFGNHAVEDGAVIKRNAVLLGVRDGVGPVFGAIRKTDEVLDSDGGYLRKQGAVQVAGRGVDDGGGVGGRRCWRRPAWREATVQRQEWQRSGQAYGLEFAWMLL